MVYAEFGGQTECIMGNWKIENRWVNEVHATVNCDGNHIAYRGWRGLWSTEFNVYC